MGIEFRACVHEGGLQYHCSKGDRVVAEITFDGDRWKCWFGAALEGHELSSVADVIKILNSAVWAITEKYPPRDGGAGDRDTVASQ